MKDHAIETAVKAWSENPPIVCNPRLPNDMLVMVPGHIKLPNEGRDMTLKELLAVPGAVAVTYKGMGVKEE